MISRPRINLMLLAVAGLSALACNDDSSSPTETDPLVETMRNATSAYQIIDAAIAAGYEETSPCVSSPAGGMGFHYAKLALVDGVVDAGSPEVLLYEPAPGGEMTLVGLEFLVIADAWDPTNSSPPELGGTAFADHRDPNAFHGLPFPHYDLHAWVWTDNPDGMYAEFNPDVSCAAAP